RRARRGELGVALRDAALAAAPQGPPRRLGIRRGVGEAQAQRALSSVVVARRDEALLDLLAHLGAGLRARFAELAAELLGLVGGGDAHDVLKERALADRHAEEDVEEDGEGDEPIGELMVPKIMRSRV